MESVKKILVDSSLEKYSHVVAQPTVIKKNYSVHPAESFHNGSHCVNIKSELDCNELSVNNSLNLNVSMMASCGATKKEFESCAELIKSEFSPRIDQNFEVVENNENDATLYSEPAFMESSWASLVKLDIPVVSLNQAREEVMNNDSKGNVSTFIQSTTPYVNRTTSENHAKKNVDPTTLADYPRQFLLFGYYHCNYCNHNTKCKFSIRKHIEATHLNKRKFKCHLCKFRANYSSNLMAHINFVHKGLKPFSCPHCVFSTTGQHRLNFHISSVHEKHKPFTCPHCPFATSRRHYIKNHISTVHKRIKAYSCSKCESSFSQRSSLLKHISVVHSKIKRYSCPHCEYMAKRKDYIDKHILSIHEGQKPFSCSYCEYTTSRKEFLKRHISCLHN